MYFNFQIFRETRLRTTINKNNFQLDNKISNPTDGIQMGIPVSGILWEIFLQELEENHSEIFKVKYNVMWIFRYLDDILITFGDDKYAYESIVKYLNTIQKKSPMKW